MTQSRIYLCGPMTGYPDLNFPAFHAETARLRALGFDVVNPAEINPAGGKWEQCMRRDIAELVACSLVATLPGSLSSRGAFVELTLARGLSIPIVASADIISADQF